MHHGWYQVAFSRDVRAPLTEVRIEGEPFALVRTDEGPLAAISAWCPHRGANLCRGGQLDGDAILCPFHGFRVGLDGKGRFPARRLDVAEIGGLVFVRQPGGEDAGLMKTLHAMADEAQFVPGFELALRADAELVIENAFDQSHFRTVHRVENTPQFRVENHAGGAYSVSGSFALPTSPWQKGRRGVIVDVPFRATAYSPTIVLSNLGGDHPYNMITTTVPISATETIARLSLIMPGNPTREDCLYLLEQAKAGLMQDAVIWEGMRRPEVIDPVDSDSIILGFRAFSDGLRTGAHKAAPRAMMGA